MMKTHINLLPLTERRKNALLSCLRIWVLVWLVGACLVATNVWSARTALHIELEEFRFKERAAAPIKRQISAIAETEQKSAALQHDQVIQLGLKNVRPVNCLLGVISQSNRKCDGKLYLEKLELNRSALPREGSEAFAESLTMEGMAIDNLDVAKFVSLLRDTQLFARVDLKSSVAIEKNERSFLKYVIECRF